MMLSSTGEPLLGHLRGEYMAELRRKAFRAAHGREPVFTSQVPEPPRTDDFIMACRLVNNAQAYAEFDRLVRESPRVTSDPLHIRLRRAHLADEGIALSASDATLLYDLFEAVEHALYRGAVLSDEYVNVRQVADKVKGAY